MPRQRYPCYRLVPGLPGGTGLDFKLHYASEHGQITIGPRFRLCGPDGAAHLATLELAERAREALLPRFRKRHGPDTEIRIGFCEVGGSHGRKRIEQDTAIVQARLDQNVLAPNQRPVMAT